MNDKGKRLVMNNLITINTKKFFHILKAQFSGKNLRMMIIRNCNFKYYDEYTLQYLLNNTEILKKI